MTTFEGLAAVQRGAGVGPVERRGLLRATGADARDYLHRMLTQAVKGLAAGETRYTCLLTAKGHLVAEGHLLGLADGLLLDLDPLALAEARATLERFVIADDVTFQDLSQTHAAVPVLGPGAAAAVAALGLAGAAVIEDGRRGAPARVLVLPAGEAVEARARLLAGGTASLAAADLESLRIAGGFARFGLDMGPERLPMEAGLTRSAIAFDKGCYVGQEVVLRATVRGQIQKGLVQLALPPEVGAGSALRVGGAEVGAVTSAADGPEGRLGLAIVKRSAWPAGTRLATDGGEAVVRRLLVEEPPPAAAL